MRSWDNLRARSAVLCYLPQCSKHARPSQGLGAADRYSIEQIISFDIMLTVFSANQPQQYFTIGLRFTRRQKAAFGTDPSVAEVLRHCKHFQQVEVSIIKL